MGAIGAQGAIAKVLPSAIENDHEADQSAHLLLPLDGDVEEFVPDRDLAALPTGRRLVLLGEDKTIEGEVGHILMRRRSFSRNGRISRSPPRKQERRCSPRREHFRERNRSSSASPRRRNTRQRSISRSRSRSPRVDPRIAYFNRRREHRLNILERGAPEVWGQSPDQRQIEEAYQAYMESEETKRIEQEMENLKRSRNQEKKLEEKKRRADVMKDSSMIINSDIDGESPSKSKKEKKKGKKAKKEKKARKAKKKDRKAKKKKAKKNSDDDDSDEWVEVTHDMRVEQAEREAREEQEMPGPALPEHLQARSQIGSTIKANYGKDMLKGEAAAMAAYAARGERIPRRGEIGLSSAEISEFEKVGYVMSGTRHKAMEATRLRKENQVLTAEEKRLLSGFSQEERKKKELAMLGQMRNLIASKRAE
uniref:NF-kappa-B-activating protein C-terminal domain-containing protein n=1 Tax=Haemonchus contortus TaxID=6289 RepID=W6NSA3_HAECO